MNLFKDLKKKKKKKKNKHNKSSLKEQISEWRKINFGIKFNAITTQLHI